MKKLFTLFILFYSISLNAQTQIKGAIQTTDNSKIELYDIIITDFNNLTITNKTFYENTFNVKTNFKDSAIFIVNAMGYKTFTKTIFKEKMIDFGELKIEPLSIKIKQVEVKGKKKKAIERVNGNIVINVANSSLENEVSVADVLKKSSGVIISPNGDINVIGKGNKSPLIVIDDIESDKSALDNLQPSQIKSIEIIKNPSAIYSADATSVIKVTTYNGVYKGWNMKIMGQVTKAKFFRYYGAVNLGYNHKKFGFDLFYGYNPYVIGDEKQYDRSFKDSNFKLLNTINEDSHKPHYHDLNLKLRYKLSEKTSLQLATYNNIIKGKNVTDNTIKIKKDSIIQSIIKTDIVENIFEFENNNTASVLYKIDTFGTLFKTTARFLNLTTTSLSDIVQDNSKLETANSSKSYLFSLQPTFEYTFKKAKISTTYGLRYEYIQVNSSNKTVDTQKSYSDINENIFASFIQAKKTIKKFDFSAGLRFEYSDSKGNQNDTIQLFDRKNYNLFPNASIQYNIAEDWQLYTSYSYKIDRPSFGSLTAFTSYLDTLSSFNGNARLLPEYTHLVDLGISYKEVASFDLSYSVTKNPLTLFVETEEGTLKSSALQKNFDTQSDFTAMLTIPYQTSFWTTYNVIGYSRQEISSKEENFHNKNDMFFFILYNEFNYKKYISINGSFRYFTKGSFNIYTFKPYYTLSLGLKSNLIKNRLQIYVQWNDILRSEKYNLTTSINNLDLRVSEYNDSNLIRVGFVFKLNNAFKNLKEIKDQNNNIDRFKNDK